MAGQILNPATSGVVEANADAAEAGAELEGQQQVPSVFSLVQRYMIGGAEVTPPAADGSRIVRLHAGSGQSMIEAALSSELCDFLAEKLVEVKIIEQGDEDAGSTE